jgi:hypothetical protein
MKSETESVCNVKASSSVDCHHARAHNIDVCRFASLRETIACTKYSDTVRQRRSVQEFSAIFVRGTFLALSSPGTWACHVVVVTFGATARFHSSPSPYCPDRRIHVVSDDTSALDSFQFSLRRQANGSDEFTSHK